MYTHACLHVYTYVDLRTTEGVLEGLACKTTRLETLQLGTLRQRLLMGFSLQIPKSPLVFALKSFSRSESPTPVWRVIRFPEGSSLGVSHTYRTPSQ